MKNFLNLKNLFLLAIILTALGAVPRLNAFVTRSVFGEADVDDGSVYALVALASSNLSISLSKFYTDASSAPLPKDSFGNPKVSVLFDGSTVSGTNPNEILAWIKVTNTGLLSLQSLSTNETLPVDWSVNPPWMMPSTSAIHSFFQFTNGSAVEITDPSGISATAGNPQTVLLNISKISGTAAGKRLTQNESILLSVKLRYALIGTTQSPASYPRNYSDTASATAGTGNFSAGTASSSNSASFLAYACGITCSGNITVPNQPDKCGATVNYLAPMTTGTGCGMVTCTPPSGFFFPVGTTTVNCTTDAGASCSFAVMVIDTQPPTITCPGSISTAAAASCPIATSKVVTFPNPTASDNCPGTTVACTPPSGSPLPPGTTTVTCTATDAAGNMSAPCTFTVTEFSFCLQDETNPGNFVLINAQTGEYVFFCNGVQIASGNGTLTTKGCIGSIEHNKGDRRVYMEWDTSAEGKGKGTAIVQLGVNNTRCQITDKSMNNNTCTAPAQVVSPVGKPGKWQSQN